MYQSLFNQTLMVKEQCLRVGIAGSMSRSSFKALILFCQIAVQKDCASVHCHQLYGEILFPVYPPGTGCSDFYTCGFLYHLSSK